MRALYFKKFGPVEQAQLREMAEPSPGKGEVRIRVHASSVNDFDIAMMTGVPYVLRIAGLGKPKYKVSGCDVAGVIESVGEGVQNLKVGDRVVTDLSDQKWGGYADMALSSADRVSIIPEGMSFCEAATLPQAGVLALQAIREISPLETGKTLLVNGAGGGAGHIIIKLAKQAGMTVIAVDSAEKEEFLLSCGADEFIDYRKVTYQRSSRKFDRIIDLKASGRALQFSRALKDKGRFTLVGGQAGSIISVLAFGPLISLTRSKKVTIMTHRPNKADVDELLKLCEDRVLQPMIDRVFELEDWHEAFDYYTSFEMKGKVILDIGGC